MKIIPKLGLVTGMVTQNLGGVPQITKRCPKTIHVQYMYIYPIEGKLDPFCYCRLRTVNWAIFPLYRPAICPPSAAAAGQGSNRLWEARGRKTKRTPESVTGDSYSPGLYRVTSWFRAPERTTGPPSQSPGPSWAQPFPRTHPSQPPAPPVSKRARRSARTYMHARSTAAALQGGSDPALG